MVKIIELMAGLLVLGVVFGIMEWRWPSIRGQKRLRRGFSTDLLWWLFTPTAGKLFGSIVTAGSVIILAAIFGLGITGHDLKAGIVNENSSVSQWPIVIQILAFLLLADFLNYWQHRAFHHFGKLWRIHAVHHSSTELDWLSSVRVHPFNDSVANTVVAAPLLLLGFAPTALAAYLPFLTLYAIAIHANVSWGLGPLGKVISTPAFHRWHHSAEAEALDKNFGGFLTVFDRIFGTYYMPKDKRATVFGIVGNPVPEGFLPQLLYPLREKQEAGNAAAHPPLSEPA